MRIDAATASRVAAGSSALAISIAPPGEGAQQEPGQRVGVLKGDLVQWITHRAERDDVATSSGDATALAAVGRLKVF